jgi:aspartate/methionine/tyrosine aminotransferase
MKRNPMKLYLLAQDVSKNNKKMIYAGIGRPTHQINQDMVKHSIEYWKKYINNHKEPYTNIFYGQPEGELDNRIIMSKVLNSWYDSDFIDPNSIIFTIGALHAMSIIFKIINNNNYRGSIITTLPYYQTYNEELFENNLHFINLQNNNFKLNAELIKTSIKECPNINAFLFCDPNNPLGIVIGEEWKNIEIILKSIPEIPIIIDEVYSRLTFNGKHRSILTLCPELRSRLIIIDSSSKIFSASGERASHIICFNPKIRKQILEYMIVTTVHLPKSLQYAYSRAFSDFDEKKRSKIVDYYKSGLKYVYDRLIKLNIHTPNIDFPSAGFYIVADLKKLQYMNLSETTKNFLDQNKNLISDKNIKFPDILSDIEICCSLIIEDHIMLMPMSYCGIDPFECFVRITCNGNLKEMKELCDRLEKRIKKVSNISKL